MSYLRYCTVIILLCMLMNSHACCAVNSYRPILRVCCPQHSRNKIRYRPCAPPNNSHYSFMHRNGPTVEVAVWPRFTRKHSNLSAVPPNFPRLLSNEHISLYLAGRNIPQSFGYFFFFFTHRFRGQKRIVDAHQVCNH
jgi:hypothetical protein